MPLRVYNNIFSINAQRHLGNNNTAMGTSLERLSSGLRVNRGADDAASLAISETLRSHVRSLGQALRNANDGVSMINTAEGALAEQSSILIRMRELASQSATGTVSDEIRPTIDKEFTALTNELDRIAAVTEFNGQKLIDGSLAAGAGSVVIHVGIRATANDQINLNSEADLGSMSGTDLGVAALSVDTAANAKAALTGIDSAIKTVSEGRGKLGAVQNRLVHTVRNLANSSENLQAAESQMRDADYAEEISQFTRNQILVQASTSILAQANLTPQSVLQLLG